MKNTKKEVVKEPQVLAEGPKVLVKEPTFKEVVKPKKKKPKRSTSSGFV